MPTPSWLVTVKFTTGGLLMLTPVMPMLSDVDAVKAAAPPEVPPVTADAPEPAAVPPPPPPPPHPAKAKASKPAARPRSKPPCGARSIHCDDDRCVFMSTLLLEDRLLPRSIKLQRNSETIRASYLRALRTITQQSRNLFRCFLRHATILRRAENLGLFAATKNASHAKSDYFSLQIQIATMSVMLLNSVSLLLHLA